MQFHSITGLLFTADREIFAVKIFCQLLRRRKLNVYSLFMWRVRDQECQMAMMTQKHLCGMYEYTNT